MANANGRFLYTDLHIFLHISFAEGVILICNCQTNIAINKHGRDMI